MTKNLRVWARLALCVPLVLLGACSTADKPKPAVVRSVIEQPSKPTLSVTEADTGARLVLDRSQTLVVSLAVAGNTNPDWSLVDLKPGVLTLVDSKFERALRSTNFDEAAGAMVWHFRPEAAGEVTLNFELRRPRSREPALQRASFAVTVK